MAAERMPCHRDYEDGREWSVLLEATPAVADLLGSCAGVVSVDPAADDWYPDHDSGIDYEVRTGRVVGQAQQ